MRHRNVGKQLSRSTSHRKALRRNMAASLIEHGAIRTTNVKAKELRPFIEGLITLAKKNTLHARRQVIAQLNDRAIANNEGEIQDLSVVQKLFTEIAPRYATRNGGYTRIIRLAERRIGDAGEQSLLQLVEETKATGETATAGGRGRRQRAKRIAAAQAAQAAQATQTAAKAEAEKAQAEQPAAAEPAGEQPPTEAKPPESAGA
jgi:large subunit ribosomal protein L17